MMQSKEFFIEFFFFLDGIKTFCTRTALAKSRTLYSFINRYICVHVCEDIQLCTVQIARRQFGHLQKSVQCTEKYRESERVNTKDREEDKMKRDSRA